MGTLVIMVVVFGGLVVSLGLMMGYRLVTSEGFMWFGPSVVVGFVVTLGVFATITALKLLKPGETIAGPTSNDETRR